jgi:hypothetical protein
MEKIANKGLYNFYTSSNIIRVIKSRRRGRVDIYGTEKKLI